MQNIYQKFMMVILIISLMCSFNFASLANQSYFDQSLHDNNSLFDDSTIMGTVYIDRNQNGIQDEGEEGISGVRLVTATGQIIITDQHGRYSLAAIAGGRSERGINFIIKLDKESLPEQYQLISSQAQTVRLSAGIPQKIDFRVIEK